LKYKNYDTHLDLKLMLGWTIGPTKPLVLLEELYSSFVSNNVPFQQLYFTLSSEEECQAIWDASKSIQEEARGIMKTLGMLQDQGLAVDLAEAFTEEASSALKWAALDVTKRCLPVDSRLFVLPDHQMQTLVARKQV
jgi:hypothetical protein